MNDGGTSIVDAHMHLWDPKRFRYPWLEGLPSLNRAFTPEGLMAGSTSDSVGKFVFVECGCEPSQNLAEADWITMLARTRPELKGIVAHAALERGEAVLSDLKQLATRPLVKGVRRNLQGESNDFLRQPGLIEGLKLLPQFGFTFDLCIRSSQLATAHELVERVPEVTFVLDHLGKPAVRNKGFQQWARDLRDLAMAPNVACKISGLTTEADWKDWKVADLEPYFDHALACFGFPRVLFGSDWPVATLATSYERWIETVLKLIPFANERDRAQLFQTNAERIYRV